MNKIFSLAVPALLALSLVSRPAVAQPKTLTATEVLEASAKKYAGFYQFEGNCSILIDGESAIEGEAAQQILGTANSAISFVNGRNLKVSGGSGFGGSVEALSTPDSATITLVGIDGKKTTLYTKNAPDAGSSDEFLASLTGVSGGSGAVLPALLLSDGALNSLRAPGKAEMQTAQNLGQTPCYVVTKTDAENNSVTTFWIEQDKLLLRRMETVFGPRTTPAMTATTEGMFTPEQLAQNPVLKDIKIPAMTTFYSRHLLVFATKVAQ